MTEIERKGYKIETLDDLRRISVIAEGGDPDAQQTINNFLKFDNDIERTNLPNTDVVVAVIFADYAGKYFWPNAKNNPFAQFTESATQTFMSKGGWKSNQFVEMTKQTPSLTDLQTIGDKPGIVDRLLGRGKTE